VFGLAPMARLPIPGGAQDTRQSFLGTQVGKPVPRQDPCDGDDPIVPIGRNGLEQGGWTGWQMPVQSHLAVLPEDTAIHGASRPVDPPIQWMLLGVKSHEVSSSCA